MSGPDRIWAGLAGGTHYWVSDEYAARSFNFTVEYIRRDPAVLVALPEVRALIAQLRDRAEKAEVEADFFKSEIKLRNKILDLGCVQELIADAYEAAAALADAKHEASMKWASVNLKDFDGDTDSKRIANEIRALIPADAIAARDTMITGAASWQPVATAPRNTLVDIWVQAKQKGESCRYINYQLLDSGQWFGARDLYPTDKVTHWMCIPGSPRR